MFINSFNYSFWKMFKPDEFNLEISFMTFFATNVSVMSSVTSKDSIMSITAKQC